MSTIRNPVEWGADLFRHTAIHLEAVGHSLSGSREGAPAGLPAVRQIGHDDLKDVLRKGVDDFAAHRTDVIFLCVIYPIMGIVLARFALQLEMLPMLFPLASGFALLGPLAAVGLYEMSRRREQGIETNWADAFGMIRSPSFGAMFVLGLLLMMIFVLWLASAQAIYESTLGPEPPASATAFVTDVLTTAEGWALIIVGVGVGFLFALVVLTVSVVSFPLLLDRDAGLGTAISTSVRAVAANPGPMAEWGMIVAGGLVLGTLPLFLGLIFVLPVLGHATWHLYRKVVEWDDTAR